MIAVRNFYGVFQNLGYVRYRTSKNLYKICRQKLYQNFSVRQVSNFKSLIIFEDIISKYPNVSTIPWNEVKENIHLAKCNDEKSSSFDVNGFIFNACINLNLLETGISFYKFLSFEGSKELTLTQYFLVLSLFSSNRDKVTLHSDCLREIFMKIKSHLSCNKMLFNKAIAIYSKLEDTWNYLIEIEDKIKKETEEDIYPISFLVAGAFDFGKPETGWALIKKYSLLITRNIIDSYLEYCLRKAQSNNFSEALISNLVQFCHENVQVFPHCKLEVKLNNLISILNTNGILEWSNNETFISEDGYCSHCKSNIGNASLSKKEWELLKFDILNDIIINENIYLKTSTKEIKRFLTFLSQSSHYDIVFDTLNICLSKNRKHKVLNVLKFFKDRNMKILLIGRQHLLKNKIIKDLKYECQLFLTDNLSDDDVFLIYAALYKGLNTYILTRDYLRQHVNLLKSNHSKKLFLKWQWSHQYVLNLKYSEILCPKSHSFLPQITKAVKTNDKSKYCWHLPIYEEPRVKFSEFQNVKWLCLTAKSKDGDSL